MFQPIKFGNERDSGVLTTIHTADLHFGKLNPKIEYEIIPTNKNGLSSVSSV